MLDWRNFFKDQNTFMIYDMIKGNELDVRNTDFESHAERGDKFVFHIVFELLVIVHISATRCQNEMAFDRKCSISNGKVINNEKSKFNIADM